MQIQCEISIDDKAVEGFVDQVHQTIQKAVIDQLDRLNTMVKEQKATPKPSQPAVIVPEGVDLPEAERLKAADLRTALLAGKIPDDSGILVDGKTTAKLLCVSYRTLYRLSQLKAIPEPVKIGHMTRWRLTELVEWVDNGCPSRWQSPVFRRSKR